MRTTGIILAVAIALTFAPAVFAQTYTYIVPDGDCDAITLHATRGTDFPNLGETIGADRIKVAYVWNRRWKGQRVAVEPAAGPRSLDFNANVAPEDAVVMAGIDFTPEVSGNETRTEHAKAFIYCGAKAPAADWQREAGLGLEIYPQWNGRPGEILPLKSGDLMNFIAVDRATNKLMRDVPMDLYRAGAGRVAVGQPSYNLGMNFVYPGPGRYMVAMTYRRPDPQQPEHWLVDTSTLTFEIK